MVIYGKPKNKLDYICVNSELSKYLHGIGFQPVYRWQGEIYYAKSKEILKTIEDLKNKSL